MKFKIMKNSLLEQVGCFLRSIPSLNKGSCNKMICGQGVPSFFFFRHCEREATEESWHCPETLRARAIRMMRESPETLRWVHEDRLHFDYTLLSAIIHRSKDAGAKKLRFDYTLLSAIIYVSNNRLIYKGIFKNLLIKKDLKQRQLCGIFLYFFPFPIRKINNIRKLLIRKKY